MSKNAAGGAGAACTNCFHSECHHTVDGEVGRECDFQIAVTWSDGTDSCPCERYIAAGTVCSVDGCGSAAEFYRVDASGQIARDMCARHYEKAEPYCEAYYKLTGSRQPTADGKCSVDGCDAGAVKYVLGREHRRHDMCAEHYMEARPYRRKYYELTGGREFPDGALCDVDGCESMAVQAVSGRVDFGGGGWRGRESGVGGHGPLNVCAIHYGKSAPASFAEDGS